MPRAEETESGRLRCAQVMEAVRAGGGGAAQHVWARLLGSEGARQLRARR